METQKQANKYVNWLGTLNNPDVVHVQDYLEKWFKDTDAQYVNGQLEKGENGTPHVQFFLNYKKPGKRLTQLKSHDSRAHFSVVKVDNGASDYCLKEETRLDGPWEFGIKPARKNKAGSTAERNRKILELGPELCVEQGLIPIKEYLKVKQCVDAYKLNTSTNESKPTTRGIWYWGPPGTGKSRKAHEENPDAYHKAQNKWWDGYKGQKVVLIDDLDDDCLAHYLKIWTDHYACTGEIKGGTVPLLHDRLIVTSNYSIETLFAKKGEEMIEAIKRRFEVHHFDKL